MIEAVPFIGWPTATAIITAISVSNDVVGYDEVHMGYDDSRIAPVHASRVHAQYALTIKGRSYYGLVVADPATADREQLTQGHTIRIQYNEFDPSDNHAPIPVSWDNWLGVEVGLVLLSLGVFWSLGSGRGLTRA